MGSDGDSMSNRSRSPLLVFPPMMENVTDWTLSLHLIPYPIDPSHSLSTSIFCLCFFDHDDVDVSVHDVDLGLSLDLLFATISCLYPFSAASFLISIFLFSSSASIQLVHYQVLLDPNSSLHSLVDPNT